MVPHIYIYIIYIYIYIIYIYTSEYVIDPNLLRVTKHIKALKDSVNGSEFTNQL